MYTSEIEATKTGYLVGYLIRNKYGNIFCRILIKDFQHSIDPWLLAHYAAKEICNRLNGMELDE
jgi:hypothetical protein